MKERLASTSIPQHVQEALEKLNATTSRRNFLKSSGLLVVSFSAAPLMAARIDPWCAPRVTTILVIPISASESATRRTFGTFAM